MYLFCHVFPRFKSFIHRTRRSRATYQDEFDFNNGTFDNIELECVNSERESLRIVPLPSLGRIITSILTHFVNLSELSTTEPNGAEGESTTVDML